MNRTVLPFVLAAGSLFGQEPDAAAELDRVARTASVMVDGDVCRRIQTARSREHFLKVDARDQWAASDNYDVNHENFLRTKKTLIRLARLCPQACDVNLWMPVEGAAGRIRVVIRNVHEMSQFWTWGQLHQEMPVEMKRVLETGELVTVRRRPGMVSVLAPVYDSLGDIAGLVEVVSQSGFDPRENVK
jgi:hypothetical protein